jgi:hypothetical protein
MNTIKMFWMMLTGLFARPKFFDREDFWEWYWEQIPNTRYPNEPLWEAWDTFKYYITCRHIIFDIRMGWEARFNRKNFGYSYTFGKEGYFIKDNEWFVPCDKSFIYGCVDITSEYQNGNPYFIKK